MPPNLIVIQSAVIPVYFWWCLLDFRFSERTYNTYGIFEAHFGWRSSLSVYKCHIKCSRTGTRYNSSISGHYGTPARDFGSLELLVRCKGWSKIWTWTTGIHRVKWFGVPERSEFGLFIIFMQKHYRVVIGGVYCGGYHAVNLKTAGRHSGLMRLNDSVRIIRTRRKSKIQHNSSKIDLNEPGLYYKFN